MALPPERRTSSSGLVERMDAHDRTFALIGIAKALQARAPEQVDALLQEAATMERTVPDSDLVAAGLREIGKVLSEADHPDQARAFFQEAIERAATEGELGSSTVADAAAELANLGESRIARVAADRYCTASDRLRVYTAILSPSADAGS